jgi:hypothetical protein
MVEAVAVADTEVDTEEAVEVVEVVSLHDPFLYPPVPSADGTNKGRY